MLHEVPALPTRLTRPEYETQWRNQRWIADLDEFETVDE